MKVLKKTINPSFWGGLKSQRKRGGRGRDSLASVLVVLLVLGVAGTAMAEYAAYNRPNPFMDYVPQEIGTYDTVYSELEEADCRGCHGNSLADRHHLTETVVVYDLCTPCHEEGSDTASVVVIGDCTTSGCHSWDDVYTNGWHHDTDLSDAGQCVSCHDPNVIAEISPFRDTDTYPPSLLTPTPFSCENCHWGQDQWVTGNPDHPGHPSSYDHYDVWGNFVGFIEYSMPIYGSSHTHHMGFKGNVSPRCHNCHSPDVNSLDWDPYNPALIRYCEICHTPDTLHMIGPHVQDTYGWEAEGFHVPLGNTMTRDVDPVVYRTWDATGPHIPETEDGFEDNQMCFGCHGDNTQDPPYIEDCTGNKPTIYGSVNPGDPPGISPNRGSCGTTVTLRGHNFGDEQLEARKVQMRQRSWGVWISDWMVVPIVSWTDTRIEFRIPCGTYTAGNYRVQVHTECGDSNRLNFSLRDGISVQSISPDSGPHGTWIMMQGANFGTRQMRIFSDGYHGVYSVVDLVSSQGVYTARHYQDWTDTSIQVGFTSFFEDGMDPDTGERNSVQDDGTGSCPDEPPIYHCDGWGLGVWSVYVKTVYFGDDDATGDLSCGDRIFQVVTSAPMNFEITNEPHINRCNPTEIELNKIMRITGYNFGLTQGPGDKLYVGSWRQYLDDNGREQLRIKNWSTTRIKFRIRFRSGWSGTDKSLYVWVVKGGVKSNPFKVKMLEPSI